jgi:DNA polymerase III delta subunit
VSITHFIQEIKKGLPKPVYLLYADDQFFLKEASLIAAGTIDESERDFCFSRSDLSGVDGSPSFAHILDMVNTIPFTANRSLAVIENIQEISKRDMALLEGYVANPSPFATLILLHRGGLKERFKPFAAKVRSIPLDIRQKDLPPWLKEKARQKGIELTERAVDYLLGTIGPDAGSLSSEIEKFLLLGKERIDLDDIHDLVRGTADYDVFSLIDALKAKDSEKVFRISKILQETREPYALLGALNWHYSKMASGSKDRKGMHHRKIFELLKEADLRTKSSGGAYPLEDLLIRLLQI